MVPIVLMHRFLANAYSGRMVLVAGVDIVPGTRSLLLKKLAPELPHDFAELFTTLADPQHVCSALAEPDLVQEQLSALREIVRVPWAMVLSSAPHPVLADSITAAEPSARRVRHLYVSDLGALAIMRNPSLMPFVHMGE